MKKTPRKSMDPDPYVDIVVLVSLSLSLWLTLFLLSEWLRSDAVVAV